MARGASKHWGTGGYGRELCDGVVWKNFLKVQVCRVFKTGEQDI